jgi:hypothetical protein
VCALFEFGGSFQTLYASVKLTCVLDWSVLAQPKERITFNTSSACLDAKPLPSSARSHSWCGFTEVGQNNSRNFHPYGKLPYTSCKEIHHEIQRLDSPT